MFLIREFGGRDSWVDAGIKGFKQDVREDGHCPFFWRNESLTGCLGMMLDFLFV